MKIDGSCHCGRVTFTADVNPNKVNLCHCDCQALSGTPFRASAPTWQYWTDSALPWAQDIRDLFKARHDTTTSPLVLVDGCT
jgi:hypothetical protein